MPFFHQLSPAAASTLVVAAAAADAASAVVVLVVATLLGAARAACVIAPNAWLVLQHTASHVVHFTACATGADGTAQTLL
jgi:hypothetical protein